MALIRHMLTLAVVAVVLAFSLPSAADTAGDDFTLQERFASKDGRLYAHLSGTALIRDDFYFSPGLGLEAGYYFNEQLGVELRGRRYYSRLSHTGRQMAEDHQLVPDMRAPQAMVAAGARYSWGYGKVLADGDFLVHFDPQLITHLGVTFAEERVVPTVSAGAGFLAHWRYGFQTRLDLQVSFHAEGRDRGWVVATGFAPVLSVGWSPPMGVW